MLTIHHLGISQSERIVWLCEELGIPYALKHYDRDPVSRFAPPAYKALHPAGTSPTITDGDLVMAESGAIIEYIIAKHGDGRLAVSADKSNFADYLYWFHFANGTMMGNVTIDILVSLIDGLKDNVMISGLSQRAVRSYEYVERHLGARPYFAGPEFTAADIMMAFPFTTARYFGPRDLTPYPNIRAYLKRIGDRPAYQRAMAKGDPTMKPNLA